MSHLLAQPALQLGLSVHPPKAVTLAHDDLRQHVAIIGGHAGRDWEDVLALAQLRSGGGGVIFDLWPTPERLARFAGALHEADAGRELYVLDTARPKRCERWNPMETGGISGVVEKLLALKPPGTTGANPSALEVMLTVVVRALQAAEVRFTLSDMCALLQTPEALYALRDAIPEGSQRTAFAVWLSMLSANRDGSTEVLRSVAGRYVAWLEQLCGLPGAAVFDTAQSTLDMSRFLAGGACLYVPIDRKDDVSMAVVRLLMVEVNVALLRVTPSPGVTPLVFLGDLGRLIPMPAHLRSRATGAGVGLVVCSSGEEVDAAQTFTRMMMSSAGTRLLCEGGFAFGVLASFLGANEQTSLLMCGNTLQLVVRPPLAAAGIVEVLPMRHPFWPLNSGETIIDLASLVAKPAAKRANLRVV